MGSFAKDLGFYNRIYRSPIELTYRQQGFDNFSYFGFCFFRQSPWRLRYGPWRPTGVSGWIRPRRNCRITTISR